MKKTVNWDDIGRELQGCVFPDEENEIIIWGATPLAQVVTPLLLQEKLNISAFCDNDKEKWDTQMLGLPCVAPQKLKEYRNPFVLVSAIRHYAEISKQVSEMDIPCCTVDAFVAMQHLSSFHEAYSMLDEESQNIYATVLSCRIRGDFTDIRDICTDNQYFALPEFRYSIINETFVDCGAYTGENIQTFISNLVGKFSKIYAFEPNSATLAALKRRMAFQRSMWNLREEQIVCKQAVLAKEGGAKVPIYITADATATTTQKVAGNVEWVEAISLDEFFKDEHITFLKADIEGSEWDMLLGGERTIQTDKPKIAICLYHNIYDFFRIPLLLKKWVPEYRFAVRQHWIAHIETVLYCYL